MENGVHVLSLGISYLVFVGMRAFREEGRAVGEFGISPRFREDRHA